MAHLFQTRAIVFALCVTFSLGIAELTSMTLQDGAVTITRKDKESQLDLPCTARVGSCTFEFLMLPPGWSAKGNSIIIPTQDIGSIRSFALQANISEPSGDSMIRNIIIDFEKDQGLFRSTLVSNSNVLPTTKIEDLKSSKASNSGNKAGTPSANNTPEPTLPYFPNGNVLASVPSIAQLDQLIFKADPYEISSTLQNIYEFKLDCAQKLPYLQQLIARIEEHIDYNRNALRTEQTALAQTQSALISLQEEKNSIQQQLTGLGDKAKLEATIADLEFDKQDSYSQYVSNNLIALRYKELFDGMLNTQVVSPKELIKVKKEIKEDQKQLDEVNAKIKELTGLKSSLENRLKSNQKKVIDTEASSKGTKDDPSRLADLEAKFKQYSEQASHFKQLEEETTKKLDETKQKLEGIRGSYDKLTARLAEIDKQIKDGTAALTTDQMKVWKSRIDVLDRNLPKLQEQAGTCKKQRDAAASEPVNLVYITHPDAVATHEMKLQPSKMAELRTKESSKTALNINSSNWIRKFGAPNTYSFTCASSGQVTGHGVVMSIIAGDIKVQDENGNIYTLHLGVCSKLFGDSPTYAPSIGDVVDWKGKPITTNIYNVYRAIFYALPE